MAPVQYGQCQNGLDQFQAKAFLCVPVTFGACLFEDSMLSFQFRQSSLVCWLFLPDLSRVSAQWVPRQLAFPQVEEIYGAGTLKSQGIAFKSFSGGSRSGQ